MSCRPVKTLRVERARTGDGRLGGRALEWLSEQDDGCRVTIEVAAIDLGDQQAVESLPLAYVECDPGDDTFSAASVAKKAVEPVASRFATRHQQHRGLVGRGLP